MVHKITRSVNSKLRKRQDEELIVRNLSKTYFGKRLGPSERPVGPLRFQISDF